MQGALLLESPQSAEGEWVLRWWAPWLDESFPNPAKPGELRWVAMIPGEGERWVDGPEPFTHRGEVIRPLSRSFIPGRVTDNRYLGPEYIRTLQALPEPLRSQILYGDFRTGRSDDEWQVCPSAHVKAAMDRWNPSDKVDDISSLGVDPSRGGDETIIAVRRGWRFDPLIAVPPAVASTGGGVTKKILDVCGDSAPVHVDSIGVGASVIDHLEAWIHRRCVPVNFASASKEADFTGNLKFVNRRAEAWWRMREILEPSRAVKVALPRDQRLFADLCAPRYRLTSRGIQIEGKEEIIRRLGRSPDRGDAVVLASIRTPIIRDNRSNRFNTYRAWEG